MQGLTQQVPGGSQSSACLTSCRVMLVLGLRCEELGFSCLTWELVRKAESGAQPRPTESELWGRGPPSLQPNLPAPPPPPGDWKGPEGEAAGRGRAVER